MGLKRHRRAGETRRGPCRTVRQAINCASRVGKRLGDAMTTADATITPTLDTPTVLAAVTTLAFAVASAAALSNLPQDGAIGGALDALKNIVYVLTVPLFDVARRLFARRSSDTPSRAATPAGGANVFSVAFVTGLVLFILIELLSWLTGFSMGAACVLLGQAGQVNNFGQCLTIGISVLGTALIAPIMIALGATAGWIWKGLLDRGFLLALLILAVVLAGLFSIDFFILLQRPAGEAQALQDQFNAIGPVRQIGLQVVLLTVGVLLGNGARRLWHGAARVFG
jgi:hypothetical protein